MKTKLLTIFLLFPIVANAGTLGLDDALRATYVYCVGIDDELADLKKMAGINTAVTAVGTAAGAAATTVGIIKANKDSQAKAIADAVVKDTNALYSAEYIKKYHLGPTEAEIEAFKKEFLSMQQMQDEQWNEKVKPLRDESKKLGNWRTGLMAGNTATNVAGAIIAGNNKVDSDLQTQIDNCRASVKNLKESIIQARVEGADENTIQEANNIVSACSEYEYVDVSKINDRAKGAMISSIVGATTGVAGTVTSAVANSDNIRKDYKKFDKTEEEWQTEKNWNTAANVLAGASTAASGVATVFNATQISAIKKVAAVAEKCTGVLK